MKNEERKMAGMLWVDYPAAWELQIKQRSLAYDYNHTRPDQVERRQELLQQIFGHLGKDVWIEQPISLSFGKYVSIGDRTYINGNFTLVDDIHINIGNDVLIGPNVTLIGTNHPLHKDLRPHGEMYSEPVKIEDYVWLCAGVTVCPGVTIGEGQ